MILAAQAIVDRLNGKAGSATDPLVITPLPRDLDEDPAKAMRIEQFDGSAIDLRLGTWFELPRASAISHFDVRDDAAKDDEPRARHTKTVFRPFGGEFFLPPRQFVLASTLEWIRLPSDLAGSVTSKSSWGRRGLVIATAVSVHPHFSGCLTLELANLGETTIALQPGVRICQLSLHQLTSPAPAPPDHASFVGYRRPVLAPIRLDDRARALIRPVGTAVAKPVTSPPATVKSRKPRKTARSGPAAKARPAGKPAKRRKH
jgi:dCTP deaminase